MTASKKYNVQAGESLYSISKKHNTNVDTIISLNPQLSHDPDLVNEGYALTVPSLRPMPELASLTLRSLPSVKASSRTTIIPPRHYPLSSPILSKGAARRANSHLVAEGDSLSLLSSKYSVPVEKLKELNDLTQDKIQPGWILALPRSAQAKARYLNRTRLKTNVQIESGDTLAKIAARHDTSIRKLQEINNLRTDRLQAGAKLKLPVDDSRPMKDGRPALRKGYRRTRIKLFNCNRTRPARTNWAEESRELNRDLEKRSSRNVLFKNRPRVRLTMGTAKRRFQCPVPDGFVSSGFGWRWGRLHEGIDLAAETGAPIFSALDGTVHYADWSGGYGKLLCISHGAGFSSRYAHCDELEKKVGQNVRAGERIGTVGATGRVTGPHLHFEIRLNGVAQDPHDYLDTKC
mmetsp:Transcript_40021/g.55621  ORF Transcript_40021/g.55621 Transcript_40021/m.55621 type:complete len:405 (-) Transcript_40021:154-1368(-)|eukprot:CAMPEP_0196581738 /NCGR_PEP_ID=MMETSP1081-20130531/35276_1 /TAXON_ID=36882 /ORGANISM="Pyramimonas amylifera, Strain CCMP720" /LENGTH=404 /DNA_ID=CAMNT_0041902075 /DNA_START=338 /DNA_END=1552 /DNA_ORIENTATION=+